MFKLTSLFIFLIQPRGKKGCVKSNQWKLIVLFLLLFGKSNTIEYIYLYIVLIGLLLTKL